MTLLESLTYETQMPRTCSGKVIITTAPEGYHAIPAYAHRRQVAYLWFENYRCVELNCCPRTSDAEQDTIERFAAKIGLREATAAEKLIAKQDADHDHWNAMREAQDAIEQSLEGSL